MKIGFVGIGLLGRPMTGPLLAGGHELLVNDLFLLKNQAPLPAELKAAGAVECKSLKELASRSEIVITMVPDTPDVERVLFGDDGIAAGLGKGKTLVDMSSISPRVCLNCSFSLNSATRSFSRGWKGYVLTISSSKASALRAITFDLVASSSAWPYRAAKSSISATSGNLVNKRLRRMS